MLSTRDTYDSLDKGTALNVVLSQDSVAQIVYTLAENGYSAIDYFGNMDMQNPQPLIDFGNAVNAGAGCGGRILRRPHRRFHTREQPCL